MKMDVRHEMPAPIDVTWREMHSEPFVAAQREVTGTSGEVVSEEALPGGKIHRQTRVRLGQELPSVAANLLGSKYLSYILDEVVDAANYTTQWQVIVDKVSSKVKAAGTFKLVPLTATSCQRVVLGEVKVSVPLVGGRIEKGISAELTKSYDAAADFARDWLSKIA